MPQDTLKLPELSLILLIGSTGAGKSTFARRLFKPTEIVSSDACRGLVADDENDQSASKDAFELLHYLVAKRLKRGLLPSQDHEAELVAMMDRLIANTRTAASLFMTADARLARDLAGEKLVFRKAEQDATSNHFSRMRDGVSASSQSAGLQVDLMRDLKLINSHIVAAAAYPVLDRAGELLPMRLAGSVGLE